MTNRNSKKIIFIGSSIFLGIVLLFSFTYQKTEGQTLGFRDIGLRLSQLTAGIKEIVQIAINPNVSDSRLRIAKNGQTYSVALVAPNDPYATKALIKLPDGTIKALRRLGLPFEDKFSMASGSCGAHGTIFSAEIKIKNPYPNDLEFILISKKLEGNDLTPEQEEKFSAPVQFTLPANKTESVYFGTINLNGCVQTPGDYAYPWTYSATYKIVNPNIPDPNNVFQSAVTYSWEYPY
jgi:hypothetical protein